MKTNVTRDIITLILTLIVTAIIFLTITSVAESATYQIKNQERLIVVPLEIEGNILSKVKQLDDLSSKSKEPVDIIVNSFGGSVITGSLFIGAMERAKLRGVKLNCIVTGFAMSMGYHILSHCDRRMALEYSYLLFHEAYTIYIGLLTKTKAIREAKELITLTSKLEEYTKKTMGISDAEFNKHNRLETLWTAETLNNRYPEFIEIILDCEGMPATIGLLGEMSDSAKAKLERLFLLHKTKQSKMKQGRK